MLNKFQYSDVTQFFMHAIRYIGTNKNKQKTKQNKKHSREIQKVDNRLYEARCTFYNKVSINQLQLNSIFQDFKLIIVTTEPTSILVGHCM